MQLTLGLGQDVLAAVHRARVDWYRRGGVPALAVQHLRRHLPGRGRAWQMLLANVTSFDILEPCFLSSKASYGVASHICQADVGSFGQQYEPGRAPRSGTTSRVF